MKTRGFTLIEVLIVIALIGIILAIAVPDYNSTMTKTKIESQTKELHSTIMNARLSAMQNKQPVAILLGPNQYTYNVYTTLDYTALYTTPPTCLRQVPSNSASFPFELKKKPSSGTTLTTLDITSDKIIFDARGFTNNNVTLVVTPVKYSGGDDCIVVHTARTNIGRMENATTCRTR